MILRKYGVELHSLNESDIELVRSWRNQSFVRENMRHQELISDSDQKKWYKNLTNKDLYYIIQFERIKIGVINVKSIDWKKREGEAGIFIGDKKYHNSHISMLAILTLMDFFLEDFSFNKLIARTISTNNDAIQFNQELGYKIVKSDVNEIEFSVSKPDYKMSKKKFSSLLRKVNLQQDQSLFSEAETELLFLK